VDAVHVCGVLQCWIIVVYVTEGKSAGVNGADALTGLKILQIQVCLLVYGTMCLQCWLPGRQPTAVAASTTAGTIRWGLLQRLQQMMLVTLMPAVQYTQCSCWCKSCSHLPMTPASSGTPCWYPRERAQLFGMVVVWQVTKGLAAHTANVIIHLLPGRVIKSISTIITTSSSTSSSRTSIC